MSTKKLIGAALLTLALSAGVASAQTYTTTGTSATTGASTSIPGTPNTGQGGNAAENVGVLGGAALLALGSAAYLMTRDRIAP